MSKLQLDVVITEIFLVVLLEHEVTSRGSQNLQFLEQICGYISKMVEVRDKSTWDQGYTVDWHYL